MSAQPLDSQMARLEGAFEQVGKRLDGVEQNLRSLRDRVDDGFDRVLQRMDRQFFWLLGLIIVSILLPLSGRIVPH